MTISPTSRPTCADTGKTAESPALPRLARISTISRSLSPTCEMIDRCRRRERSVVSSVPLLRRGSVLLGSVTQLVGWVDSNGQPATRDWCRWPGACVGADAAGIRARIEGLLLVFAPFGRINV